MKLYKNLYVSELVKNRKDVILEKLNSEEFPWMCYIIVLAEEEDNQLEFYSTALLHQKQAEREQRMVVGIAAGYRDAIYLVQEITKEVYEKTGGADIRSYIRKMEND